MSQVKVSTLMNADGSKQAASGDVIDGATKTKLFSPFSLTVLAGIDAAAMRSTLVAAKSGANSDITALTGLTTALTAAQGGTGATSMGAGAVGAVTQLGGVPTGAVVQRGFTAGVGDWVKFADGTMICTSGGVTLTTATIAANNIGTPINLVMSQNFIGIYTVSAQATPNSTNDHFGVTNAYAFDGAVAQAIIRNGATAQVFTVRYIAIGRWY